MADNLGVPDYNPSADINFARATSEGLQSLGAQLRADITAIQANRQVKSLGEQLKTLDPRTEHFPTDLMQAAIANPLGVQHPVGQMAISTLGAAHKAWAAENLAAKKSSESPAYAGFGSGGILNKKTGDVLREPTPTGSTAMPYSGFGSGGVLNRKTGEVLRDPAAKNPVVTPELKAYETEKSRLDAALLKTQTSLQQAAGGYDVSKLAKATKTYRVDAKGKQANDGEFVVLELPDGGKEKLPWKDFSKIHGHFAALEGLRAQRDALKPPVSSAPDAATPTEKVRVINPDGLPGMIPKSFVEAALAKGYKLAP